MVAIAKKLTEGDEVLVCVLCHQAVRHAEEKQCDSGEADCAVLCLACLASDACELVSLAAECNFVGSVISDACSGARVDAWALSYLEDG